MNGIQWTFDAQRPIYVQLVEQLKTFILSGTYRPGQRLPSVRELAVETRVNPNTMQRALIELEQEGLITTIRTSGKFVTEDKALIERQKAVRAKQLVDDFFLQSSRIGLERRAAAQLIQQNLEVQ